MKRIRLANNKGYALVDDKDHKRLSKFCWYLSDKGYAVRGIHVYLGFKKYKSKKIRMHNEIMGAPSGGMIWDHHDNNPLNNQRNNLRLATRKNNQANQKKQRRKTSSKYKGVCWDKSRKLWMSHLKKDGKRIFSKRFKTEKEAAVAYNNAAKKHFGDFARLNRL